MKKETVSRVLFYLAGLLILAVGLTLNTKAGLGVSAFTDKVPDDSAQALDPDAYRDLLDSRSKDFYARAWSK